MSLTRLRSFVLHTILGNPREFTNESVGQTIIVHSVDEKKRKMRASFEKSEYPIKTFAIHHGQRVERRGLYRVIQTDRGIVLDYQYHVSAHGLRG